MNKALQKWANNKVKTLKRWSEEYDKICRAEGIKGNHIVSFALDRDYIRSISAMAKTKEDELEIIIDTKSLFLRNGKWE